VTPLSLYLTNFGSFKGTQTFNFPHKPGLYFMRGDNQLEPRLGANGAGKSTIWAALNWLCYGTTPKGLRAGDIANWDEAKNVQVLLHFSDDDVGAMRVRRTWGPNSWQFCNGSDEPWHDLVDDETNPFRHTLGIEALPFLHSVLMAQSSAMFLDLSAKDQESLFVDVLDLGKWDGFSDKASERASFWDNVARRRGTEAAHAQGELDALGKLDLSAQIDQWEKERQKRLDGLEDVHRKLDEAKKASSEARNTAETELKEVEGGIRRGQAAYDALAADLERARIEQQSANQDLAKLDALSDALRASRTYLDSHDECETCGQIIDAQALKIGHDLNSSRQAKLEPKYLAAEAKADETCKAFVKINNKAMTALSTLTNRQTRERELEAIVGRLTREEARHDLDMDRTEAEFERIEKEANPYMGMAQDSDAKIKVAQIAIDKGKAALEQALEEYEASKYWVKGFKELRLSLIAEYLEAFEAEANQALTQLGLIDWEIRFDVDRENKSGTIRKGFSCMVKSPVSPAAVPFAAWSGGESQRLRIATTMGLSDLIRSASGLALPLEVWDEPTAGLTQSGIDDLLDCLSDRAHEQQRIIWVVDHRSLGYGSFDGVTTIIKTEQGSQIDQSEMP
jgi:DNA repair exonuclease SbcCD ATPase subunit